MAVCYITEFAALANVTGANIAMMPPIAQQTVAIGAEADSSAFNAATRYIRVHVDAICSIAIGVTPTATTSMLRMGAGDTEYFGVPLNGGYKLSVITNS
jgi:hypothetical protein